MSSDRDNMRTILRAALGPAAATDQRPPSKNVKEAIHRLEEETELLLTQVVGRPFGATVADLVERMR